MQISLRARLDTSTDRFVIEFEPICGLDQDPKDFPPSRQLKVEGLPEPVDLHLDANGYILAVGIPGLKKMLAAIAGEKPAKPAK